MCVHNFNCINNNFFLLVRAEKKTEVEKIQVARKISISVVCTNFKTATFLVRKCQQDEPKLRHYRGPIRE